MKPDQAYSEAMATRWFQQELPVQKSGYRSKPTRKEMDDSEDSDDDPAGVSRSARTRFDQDPVQFRLEDSWRFQKVHPRCQNSV